MKTHIYILIDPRTNIVKYIGQTTSLVKRYTSHLVEISIPNQRKWNKKRSEWYQNLLENDCIPIIKIIETINKKQATEREIYWINYYMNEELTNSTYNKNNPYNWNYSKNKTVYSYNEYTKKIIKYLNVNKAAKKVNTHSNNIYSAIHIKGRTKDLFWAYNKNDFKSYIIKPWINRRLVKVTDINGTTKIYKNLSQAIIHLNIPLSKHNTLTKIRKGLLTKYKNFHFEMIAHLKPGELLENCEVNQQPSLSSNTFEGSTTRSESLVDDNSPTSAGQLTS